ncbi:MAG: histidinol dehydrogenase [Phycisphaeraceae bacterium]
MQLQTYKLDNAGDLENQPWFIDLRKSALPGGEVAATVSAIIDDVRSHGDEALVKYMRKWTDPSFSADRIRVAPQEMKNALDSLEKKMRGVLERSIEHVAAYQKHILPTDPAPITIDGAEMGLRWTPVSSVGLAVPGGKAAYPSSVIMLAVPAQSAGVNTRGISVVTPPPTRKGDEAHAAAGDIAPLVLATCAMLNIERVYRIGGAQAMAALAFGTQSVEPVDMIVGPGNVFTQLAKQQLMGRVGIDGFYGPSEIVVIVDDSADPSRVAADLIAQAEHDPGRCILIAWSQGVIDGVNKAIGEQALSRKRLKAIETSLKDWSAALLVKDEAMAVAVSDIIAAEHVNLAVKEPERLLKKLRHGGAFFLSDHSPVAAGDYYAGPSHSLPTGTTARFTSGVSVYTFLKRSGTVFYREGMSGQTIDSIATFAEAEGLDGHAASVKARS